MYRLYYESLEQAHFFLARALKCGVGAFPQLVKLGRLSRTSTVGERLARALDRKDPDFIFTLQMDGNEVPLLWGEISTAVETEDHLLQRFDSLLAASLSDIPFALIHAPRKSASDHGGQTNFDRSISFRLATEQWGLPCYNILWPTTSNSLRAVRDSKALACPQGLLGLDKILAELVEGALRDGSPRQSALKSDFVWRDSAVSTTSHRPSPRSTRLFEDNGSWILKFNRWDHAMDPERGMAAYWSVALGEKLKGRLQEKQQVGVSEAARNFSKATGIRLGREFKTQGPHDITTEIRASQLSRPGLTIVDTCSEFSVFDPSGLELICFEWDDMASQRPFRFDIGAVTDIEEKSSVDEDEVSFVVAHNVLPSNEFDIHSVSYPGAQGDFPILEGKGRSVRRTYFDVIAVRGDSVVLVESKGSRTRSSLERDIAKLRGWREVSRKALLCDALGLSPSANVVMGIAYPGDEPVSDLEVSGVDFQINANADSWLLTPESRLGREAFETQRGKVSIPMRWRIST